MRRFFALLLAVVMVFALTAWVISPAFSYSASASA